MPEDNKFELPDVLPTENVELEALLEQAEAAFTARYDQGAATQEDAAELRSLSEKVKAVRDAVAQAAQASDAPPEDAPAPAEPTEPAEPAEPVVPATEGEPTAPAEPAAPEAASPAKAVLESMLLSTPPPAGTAPTVESVAVAPVAAAPTVPAAPAAQPAPASLAAAAVVEPPPEDYQMAIAKPNPLVILASADVPNVASGSVLDGMDALVAAMCAKASVVPDVYRSRHPVASIMKPLSPDRNLDGKSEKEQFDLIGDLSSVEFLVASGGWCAPSETIYDFACEVEAPPDAVVLPTASTRRGGQRFPISPTFRDFYALANNGLFTWTEANDIDALTPPPTKPCFHIPCVTFSEARLELEGLCVTAGNLTELAYPELIRRYMSLVLTGHLHRMNARKIVKMLAFVDDTVVMPATFAAASAMLSALELAVQDLRDQFSMSENAVVEAMAPRWVRGVIRADIARRECCSLDTVSNEQIRSYLQDAGIMLQFVSDWQLLGDEDNPALEWPTSVDVLLWIPGALRELTGPRLDIAVARDSVLNETNDFTVAFTEESYQIYKPGCGVRLVTIPICPSGASGERVQLVCTDESS